jgi:hypothetical protein
VSFYRIRLVDDTGTYWLGAHKDRPCWSEDPAGASTFLTEVEAQRQVEDFHRSRQPKSDWFPRVKIVRFK